MEFPHSFLKRHVARKSRNVGCFPWLQNTLEKLFRESGPTLAFERMLGKKRGISLTNVRETVDKFLSPFKKPRS